jgi:hypothetical protein
MNTYGETVRGGRSVLSTATRAIGTFAVTTVLCGTAVGIYALSIVDRKSDNLVDLVRNTIHDLPEIVESLPPVLADLLADQRRPDYAANIVVSAKLASKPDHRGRVRPIVRLTNQGDEVVSLLTMRVLVLDDQDEPIGEFTEWAASPVAVDHDWRGPLMPGNTRVLTTHSVSIGDDAPDDYHVEVEITDVRIWTPENGKILATAVGTTGS